MGGAWAAIAAYTVAIMHRSSLGVAGVQASEQFGTTPSIVSTFIVLQLLTYAFAQIPAGTVLDRVGPRAMLVGGSFMMAGGQLLLSSTDVLGLAFTARFLVGVGDACIWVSILTLIPRWFAPRLVPLLSQTAGMLTVVGQLMAVDGLPATQLGFWIHFTARFAMNPFVFMWGLPYLQGAQGLTQGAASALSPSSR